MLIDYKKATVYQEDKCILKDVDFHLEEGEFVYIIGKVGSGKSSFLKTIYAELDIDDAEQAVVLERNMMKIKRKHIPELRREMGIIFQDFQLLHDRTVEKNLQFVLKATGWKDTADIGQRITEVLNDVGMAEARDKMPHKLSGGEQQRIAIARALLNNPSLILADEPTGNLDETTGEQIMRLLHDISSKGTAVIMATHNMKITQDFPARIVRCEAKKILEV